MSAVITIVTCTRDPREDLLTRVMGAVAALRVPAGHSIEYLLVDSGSAPPLAGRAYVQRFLTTHGFARSVREESPGLAAARRRAVRETSGELLVWIDDDNVPAPDYLEPVVDTARRRVETGVWGAGRITVEFVDPVPAWVEHMQRATFQERTHERDEFGASHGWAPYFPVGSGMVTRRRTIERWAAASEAGRYSLTGRRGTALTSGDDAQIILGAVAAGERVGVVAAQALTHLIPASRCTLGYLARLEYAISASLRIARAECFPADPHVLSRDGLARAEIWRAVSSRLVRGGFRAAVLEAARRRGARDALDALSRR